MINKPVRHKETNTFKFKKFAERISDIDIDVFHRVVHRNEDYDIDDDSLETNFYQALVKWNDLNLTEGYTNFKKEVKNIVTLPQLINHKEHVIECLTRYLKLKNVGFLQPILDIVVATAKDLQVDFHEYFPHFLALIIDLLNMKDPEIVDYAFTTLAYLFKFLWRYLIKNIDTTFKLLLPLLVDSKPSYINNFAAESFAFVARKVRDRESFLKQVFKTLEETPDCISGCGKLLFEVVAGTSGQFHSCAEEMLSLYLDALSSESIDKKLAYAVLQQIFSSFVAQINPKHGQTFWEVVGKKYDSILSTEVNETLRSNVEAIKLLTKLVQTVVSHKGGRMLSDPEALISKITQSISVYASHDENNQLLIELIDLSSTILLSANIRLTQEVCNKLISSLLEIQSREMLNHVVKKLINYSSLESLILPIVLRTSVLRNEFTLEDLDLFAELVATRSPPSFTGNEIHNWRRLNLDLRNFPSTTQGFLQEILKNYQRIDEHGTEMFNEDVLKIVIILPHVTAINEELIDSLKQFFVSIFNELVNDKDRDDGKSLDAGEIELKSFALLLTLHSLIRLINVNELHEYLEASKINFLESKLLEKYPKNICILNSLDLFYTLVSKSDLSEAYINENNFVKLNEKLVKQLSSPFSSIRSTVSHVYNLFKPVRNIFINENQKLDQDNALMHMFSAESIEISVQTYRDRLIHLQALSLEAQSVKNLDPKFYECPLRYLLGNLFVNFTLLWPPISKAIASFADEKCPEFWPIIVEALNENVAGDYQSISTDLSGHFGSNVLKNLSKKLKFDDKPDYENCKVLLWKCLSEFPGSCETRNRDWTILFIENIEQNYYKSNSEMSKTFSIKKTEQSDDLSSRSINLTDAIDDDDDDDEDEEDAEEINDKRIPETEFKETPDKTSERAREVFKGKNKFRRKKMLKSKKTPKPSSFKLLLAQLKLLSLMQNPKVLYKEAELNKIYLDLLTSKSSEIQKNALDCIFSYKQKNLLLYKDHLYGLVDEKNLRNELARFKIADDDDNDDEDPNGKIPAENRETLMPILLRIIYAKLITRGTGRAAGAVGGLARRKIILRFLMGVRPEEIEMFARMVFKPFERYRISLASKDPMEDLTQLVDAISKNLDLTDVIAPQRLRSAVNLLGIVIEEFGAKMPNVLLSKLLAILVCVLTEMKCVLDKSDQVLSGFRPLIKELRTNCLTILTRFFAHFENYAWSDSELDSMFEVAIFPWLEKLPFDGIHSPTALLKLFSVWSQNPRYFCLFAKHKRDDKGFSCLPFIMQLLLNGKTHPAVATIVLEMVERLLTLADYEIRPEHAMEVANADAKVPLRPRNVLEVDPKAILTGSSLNYGSAILFPHVNDVLNFIKIKVKKSRMSVSKLEATILSRISELNLNSDTSNILLSMLLPILVRKTSRGESEQTILDLLTTIANLIKTISNPEAHVRHILPLLFNISAAPARKLLLNLLEAIANNHLTLGNSAEAEPKRISAKNIEVMRNLNAMNEKWLEQPDFQKRIDAFSQINNLLSDTAEINSATDLSLEFGVAILYNCYFYLKHETDLSLKDFSGQCLNKLGPKLIAMYRENATDRKYLIDDVILNLIRNGIKSNNDSVKIQSISFLGVLATDCADAHPVFRDLNLLTNKNDPEVDFFENLQHLQLHRKTRALLKFCSVAKTLKKGFNIKTLTQFIFPVASSYLCNESFIGKNSVIDAAIECVGIACRLLPWHQYSVILKYYLGKLRTQGEFRKQIVRIIVAILDAFHYDLSKLNEVKEIGEVNKIAENGEINIQKEINDVAEKSLEKLDFSGKHEDHEQNSAENSSRIGDDDVNVAEKIPTADTKVDDDEAKAEIGTEDETEKLLEKELIKEDDEEEGTEDIGVEKTDEPKIDELIMEKVTLLSHSSAKKLVFDINHTFLPQLQKSILARTQREISHKVNRKRIGSEEEEEELMRVPIALALVKLLQKLPEVIIYRNLPGIFMKLCTFLKSRLDSVRRVTREILQKIMVTLGPNYLHYLLRELNSLLTRGFQIHVLAYTIHAVLTSLKPFLQPKDMVNNLQSILEVCKVDLFGLSAEEKEISAITRNTSEAKSTKSFDIFHIVGQFINESCLIDVMKPLNNVLNVTRSHKMVRKITECLRNLVLGLADNDFIEIDKMLIFLYGIVSKSIPALNPALKKVAEKTPTNLLTEKTDCLLIPPEPKSRLGFKSSAKTTSATNDHVMLEFSLKLLHILLKREKLSGGAFYPYLNPFVPILDDSLLSQHVKLSTLSLQCLNWLLKMDMEAVQSNIKNICASIFKILHKFGAAGLGKGDNFDLVMAAFKTMSVIIRDRKDFELSYDQVKALVLYAEQDLHDPDRQATAFNLLRAIIARKLNVFQIHRAMKKVATLSITSESDNVRQQCRAVFYQFLMEYPLGKQLDKHLGFFLAQMAYELQPGRVSALNMVHSIIAGFPLEVLTEQSEVFFVIVGARVVNDDDPICRKHAAQCLKQIITRVNYNQRTKLFEIILTWLQDSNLMHRLLAAQLCGIFVTIEKEAFESRLEPLLPLIVKQFSVDEEEDAEKGEPGKFVKLMKRKRKRNEEKIIIKDIERAKDHHAFQVLQLTLKISSNCPALLKSEKYADYVRSVAEHCQEYLAHCHLWVRFAATQQIGFVLATLNEDKLARLIQTTEVKVKLMQGHKKKDKNGLDENEEDEMMVEKRYVYSDPLRTLKSLSLDLIAQLQPEIELEDFFDQVVKNLVFIARVIKNLSSNNKNSLEENENENENVKNEDDGNAGISIFWLMKRIRKCVNLEIIQNPKSTAVRTAAFKWIAGIIATIPIDPYLKPFLFQMMSPLVREMISTDDTNAALRQLAKDVAKMMKKKVGDEEYTKLLMRVQQKIDIKKAERKKSQTQKFITNPELAAKKKIAKQQLKKQAKKRKMLQMRGKKTGIKRRKKDIDLDIM